MSGTSLSPYARLVALFTTSALALMLMLTSQLQQAESITAGVARNAAIEHYTPIRKPVMHRAASKTCTRTYDSAAVKVRNCVAPSFNVR